MGLPQAESDTVKVVVGIKHADFALEGKESPFFCGDASVLHMTYWLHFCGWQTFTGKGISPKLSPLWVCSIALCTSAVSNLFFSLIWTKKKSCGLKKNLHWRKKFARLRYWPYQQGRAATCSSAECYSHLCMVRGGGQSQFPGYADTPVWVRMAA